ncbi:hypothetical protein [Bacillus pseudomycoides]|uniref:hypothetical protein n=1 Tax=Bacillus pseudomycoides TaxID=64104 RepID=UPI000534FA0F|nr:hypothetical protein [Bacillus pseudomycoides]
MKYYILKFIYIVISTFYNNGINIYHILQERGGNNMEIAMAVLKFVGGVLPLVQELLKAFL